MKTLVTILIVVICFNTSAQLSESVQHEFDSVYARAVNLKLPLKLRFNAYNQCCWGSVYQDYPLGKKVSSEYLALATEHNNVKRKIYANHFLGHSYSMLGELELAEECHQNGLELSLKHAILINVTEAYADIGNLKRTKGETEASLEFHKNSLEIASKNQFKVFETRAHINIGEIYEAQGKYELSLKSFQRAYKLAQKHKYTGYLSSIYEHLGDVNMSIEEYGSARTHYDKSLHFSIKHENKKRRIQSLKKIGLLNQELGDLDSALIYFQQALSFCIETGINTESASTRSHIARALFIKGQYSEALISIKLSLLDYDKIKIVDGLEEAYLTSGKIHRKLNHFKIAETHLENSFDLAKQTKKISTLKEVSFELYELFKQTGRKELALEYYEQYISFSDKLRGENEIKEVLKMEISSKFKNRAIRDSLKQITTLQEVNFKHQRAEEKSKFNLYLLIAGLVLLSLALIFTAYIFIQKRKSARQLNKSNTIIKQALKDKETLLKEVHHRVKNNMQVVSSLLSLKSKSMPNEIAKEALIDSKQRIDSMQLSHQRMYQNGNYEQIDVVSYAKDIFRVLLDPIETELDRFQVKGDELLLHVEQAQTLGYVIHEFAINSIKHAWIDNKPKLVELSFEKVDDTILITYRDNGQGLPEGFNHEEKKSFGMNVIYSLITRQLRGKISMTSIDGLLINVLFEARGLDDNTI